MNRYNYRNIDEFLDRLADTLGIKLSDDLSDNLETAYEWEYKFHKITNLKNTNEKRKNWLLQRINMELDPILDNIIQDLSTVYEKWLNNHALTNPRTWAEQRLKDLEEMENPAGYLDYIFSEYSRYVNTSREEFNYDFIDINKNLMLPYIQDFIKGEIEYYTEELNNTENEDEKQEFSERLEDLNFQLDDPDIEDYINTYYSTLKDFLQKIDPDTVEQMILDFYENIIFPQWYYHWQEKDIDSIRANNENIYNQLQSANSINAKFKIINIALNSVHVNGSMTDHISEIDSRIDSDFLNYLSNLDTSQWDKDLILLGVQ